jgi:hypothetical protein
LFFAEFCGDSGPGVPPEPHSASILVAVADGNRGGLPALGAGQTVGKLSAYKIAENSRAENAALKIRVGLHDKGILNSGVNVIDV